MEAENTDFNPEDLLRVNPKRKPLTPEKLRELSGLTLTDEKVQEIIFSIHTFCAILLELAKEKDASIIPIENTNQQKIAA